MLYERLVKHASAEFERFVKEDVENLVELAFAAQRALPDEVAKIPYIGGTYRPHAPPSDHAELKLRVCRAVAARKWFEGVAPAYLQPLPLTEAECQPWFFSPDPHRQAVADYAMALRGNRWRIEYAESFLDFYASTLGYVAETPAPRRGGGRRKRGGAGLSV